MHYLDLFIILYNREKTNANFAAAVALKTMSKKGKFAAYKRSNILKKFHQH
ncbi:variable large family protein [Borrelia recurrentis]|uniref:variable large family protein n=1 Tax=Borrelia recurrentis TaxID=44449 RepID=UPI00366C63C9